MEVKDLSGLISRYLGEGNTLVSHEALNLLSSGENYGSILLNIKIKYRDVHGEDKDTQWVAKIAPPIPFLWEFFNTPVTFKKEVGVYKDIQSSLNEFGKEHGIEKLIDNFAEYHGSRVSLNPDTDKVDRDAVLLMENLKISGYECGDRFVGFDYACTELLLKGLANLHASIIAFKLAKPDEFKAKILPHLSRDFFFDAGEEQLRHFVETLKRIAAAANPDCVQHLPKLEEKFLNLTHSFRAPLNPREPFATFVHGDLWVNNVLLKFENGVPIEQKMVDFQIIEYNSAANDVLFLIYSSVEMSVLEKRVDEFLKIYHDYFIETLKKLGTDTKQFGYEAFMEECAESAKDLQLVHLAFMHVPMFTQKGEAKELTEFGAWTTSNIDENVKRMHPIAGKRLQFILMDFVKRGWV